MKTIISKMECEKVVVTDFENKRMFDLYLFKNGREYEIWASQHQNGNMYFFVGGFIEDLTEWHEGGDWWVAIRDYILENDFFGEVVENDHVLEDYWNKIFCKGGEPT